jgi:hypothetical protein
MASYETRTRRFTRTEYDHVSKLGVFRPDEEIELIGGQVVIAKARSPAHHRAIVKTAMALMTAFGRGWYVRTLGAIALDDDSEPKPDVTVVPGHPDDYKRTHPSRPVLTVEVAESSLDADRQWKGSLYARAALADYWVVNLVDRVVEVYREPGADAGAPLGWSYARCEVFNASARIMPLAARGPSVPVSLLLP